MRTLSLLSSLILVSAGCSEDGDGSGGTGGGSGSASGTGGNGGTATTGGSAGSSSGQGGTSSGGSSGSGATSGGTGGSGGRMVPQPTGTIGNAPIACSSVECAAGSACCRAITGYSCLTSFPACECSVMGDCTVVGCDSHADCNGGVCCALRNTRVAPGYVATSCKTGCDAAELPVCATDEDCDASESCDTTTAGFGVCF